MPNGRQRGIPVLALEFDSMAADGKVSDCLVGSARRPGRRTRVQACVSACKDTGIRLPTFSKLAVIQTKQVDASDYGDRSKIG